jgi:DNA-binding Lrp family transcriptional regulator
MHAQSYKIDETGMKILNILAANSRSSSLDISKQLAVSEETVKEYIKKFEDDRIIIRYTTQIHWDRILKQEVRALIEVKVTPEHGVGFDSLAEAIYRFDEVSSVILLSGAYDLLVQVEGPSLQEVALFVSQKLSPIKGVQSTVTHFLLKKYKEDGQILVGETASKRLPFSF